MNREQINDNRKRERKESVKAKGGCFTLTTWAGGVRVSPPPGDKIKPERVLGKPD